MREQASGECRIAFYAAKRVGNGFKREVEPEAEFLWRDKVVEMEIADRAIIFMLMIGGTKLFSLFLKAMEMGLCEMLVAKRVKRLVSRREEHNSHQGQVEYGELSFHYHKGK